MRRAWLRDHGPSRGPWAQADSCSTAASTPKHSATNAGDLALSLACAPTPRTTNCFITPLPPSSCVATGGASRTSRVVASSLPASASPASTSAPSTT